MIPFVRWMRSAWICRRGHEWMEPRSCTVHVSSCTVHYIERDCFRCGAVEDLTDRGWQFIRWGQP